ncbi:6-pyruvoyl trahydropterin synthase family protein [Olsenella uli]|uniref:6-pyruvoyl trahydropterin synthase family protein n=1 Tax=Olsenella uli TaxID=133926 RepID=UPI003898FFCE
MRGASRGVRGRDGRRRQGERVYGLKTEASFDGAHFLTDYHGKCENLHGHRWRASWHTCGRKNCRPRARRVAWS